MKREVEVMGAAAAAETGCREQEGMRWEADRLLLGRDTGRQAREARERERKKGTSDGIPCRRPTGLMREEGKRRDDKSRREKEGGTHQEQFPVPLTPHSESLVSRESGLRERCGARMPSLLLHRVRVARQARLIIPYNRSPHSLGRRAVFLLLVRNGRE